MTIHSSLQVFAAFLGFAASVFFVRGSIRLNTNQIHQLASPRWDFHPEVARYLAEQRSEYICGAILLTISFVAQIISMAPFQFNQASPLSSAEGGFFCVTVVSIVAWVLAIAACRRNARETIRRVDALASDAREREERQVKERKGAP